MTATSLAGGFGLVFAGILGLVTAGTLYCWLMESRIAVGVLCIAILSMFAALLTTCAAAIAYGEPRSWMTIWGGVSVGVVVLFWMAVDDGDAW